MVKGMKIVKEESTKKAGVEFFYVEIDFGYRKAKVFDLDAGLLPELCGVTTEELYSLKVGSSLPVKFDLPVLHNKV